MPANHRIVDAAFARLPVVREMLQPSFTISFTKYPDQWQIEEARLRYGIDMRPKAWA